MILVVILYFLVFNQLFIYGHIDVCRLVRIIKPQKQNLFQSYVSILTAKKSTRFRIKVSVFSATLFFKLNGKTK